MICTNPDLVVDRGEIQEYCAGTIAKIFEEMGGEVIYFGKPHKQIYSMIIQENEKLPSIWKMLKTPDIYFPLLGIILIFLLAIYFRKKFFKQ